MDSALLTVEERSNIESGSWFSRLSAPLRDDILAYEQRDEHGLNGFVLLLHVGANREDLFHTQLGPLCDELRNRGYEFLRVDHLLRCGAQSDLAKKRDRPAPLP